MSNKTAALRPFASTYSEMLEQIDNMGDDDIRALNDAIQGATNVNCWWAEYKIAQVLRPHVDRVMRDRRLSIKETSHE